MAMFWFQQFSMQRIILLRLNFLQKWKEKLKIWNSRNQEIFVFTFVSS